MKPSDVKDIFPSFSIKGEYHTERVACWIVQALVETGDTWRKIEWQEIEPLLEEGFGPTERRMIKRLLPEIDLSTEEKARKFSMHWNLK